MEARFGLIVFTNVFDTQILIEILQCLGDNGAVVVDVFEDKNYYPNLKSYKVYWEKFPITEEGCALPRYKIMCKTYYTNDGKVYRRSYEIKENCLIGSKTIPLGSIVVREEE